MRLLVFLSILSVTSALPTDSLLELLRKPAEDKCHTLMDLFIVLDSSGSVGAAAFEEAKTAIIQMVSMMNIGPKKVQVWVINYGEAVEAAIYYHNMPVTEYTKENLMIKIKSIRYMNGPCTATGSALEQAKEICNKRCRSLKEGTPRVVLVLTDGYSNFGTSVGPQTSELLSITKASIFAIGVGNNINNAELLQIANDEKYVMHLKNYHDLISAVNNITIHTCGIPAFVVTNVNVRTSVPNNIFRYYQVDTTELLARNKNSQGGFLEIVANVHQGEVEVYTSTKDSNPGPQSGQRVQFQTRGSDLYYMEYIDKSTPRLYFSFYGVQPNNEYDFVVDWLDLSGNSIG